MKISDLSVEALKKLQNNFQLIKKKNLRDF